MRAVRGYVAASVVPHLPFPAVHQRRAKSSAATPQSSEEVIPDLSFLSSREVLLETVPGTLEVCETLLKKIHTLPTAREKHDVLDTVSNVLCLLLDPCEFVRQIHPDTEYKAYAAEAFSRGHEFMCKTNCRRDLYDVLASLSTPEAQKELSFEQNRNVAQMKRDLEANGIHLNQKQRDQITELNVEKEELASKFLMDSSGATKGSPFGTLRNLLECRHQLAQALGFESYAQKELIGTMLKNPQSVWHFLCGVTHKYREGAEKELLLLTKHLGEVKGRDGMKDEERAKIATSLQHDAEPENIAKYFSVANCVRGIQILCEEVFGVRLVESAFSPLENLSADAVKFHVHDVETKEFLGVIVLDMFARNTKHCQAGHLTIQLGCRPPQDIAALVGLQLPVRQRPVVCLTCNAGSMQGHSSLNKRPNGSYDPETTLMSPHEVVTCFHEFGHALHTIFAQTTVQNLAGTRGSIDFVETFSQLFEKFLTSHDFLKRWAVEVGSKKPISVDLVEQRNKAANMFHHLDTLDQVQLAAVDQVLHGPRPFTVYFANGPSGHIGKRTLGKMNEYGHGFYNLSNLIIDIVKPISLVEPTQHGVLKSLSFEHLSSYPAGYYGYLYSNTVAKRIWQRKFADNPMSRQAGRELVSQVMRFGAACDQHEVIQKYLGEDLNDIDVWA